MSFKKIFIILIIAISLTGCGSLREQSYERLDKEHAEKIDQTLTWFEESSQLLEAGAYKQAINKAKQVQTSLSEAISIGKESIDLAGEIYDEWTTSFLEKRAKLEGVYLSMAKLVERTATALKEKDKEKAKQSLQEIEGLKKEIAKIMSEVETLQTLRKEADKLLVPKINLPESLGEQPLLLPDKQ